MHPNHETGQKHPSSPSISAKKISKGSPRPLDVLVLATRPKIGTGNSGNIRIIESGQNWTI
jgi:hypothetical protein